jgi:hypothetical protein
MSNKHFVKKSKSNFVILTENGMDKLRLDSNFCIYVNDKKINLEKFKTCENLNNLKIIENESRQLFHQINHESSDLSSVLEKNNLKETEINSEIDLLLNLIKTKLYEKNQLLVEKKLIENQIKYKKPSLLLNLPDNIQELISFYLYDEMGLLNTGWKDLDISFSSLGSDFWRLDDSRTIWGYLDNLINEKRMESDCHNLRKFNVSNLQFYKITKNNFTVFNLTRQLLDGAISNCVFLPVKKLEYIEQLFYIPFGSSGRSLLHGLIRNNDLKGLQKLMKIFPKLNLNVGTLIDNWTPLHNAVYYNLKQMTEFLLENGASTNIPMILNKYGGVIENLSDFEYTLTENLNMEENYNFLPNKLYSVSKIHGEFNKVDFKEIEKCSPKIYFILRNFFDLLPSYFSKSNCVCNQCIKIREKNGSLHFNMY